MCKILQRYEMKCYGSEHVNIWSQCLQVGVQIEGASAINSCEKNMLILDCIYIQKNQIVEKANICVKHTNLNIDTY